MRKFTFILFTFLCLAGAMNAQNVKTVLTTDIQSGVYMMKMKSDRTTGEAGKAWLYYDTTKGLTYGEADNTAVSGKDNAAYLWNIVRNDDGTITIASFTANTYWGKASGGETLNWNSTSYNADDNKWRPNELPMSATANNFTLVAKDNGSFQLKTYSTKTKAEISRKVWFVTYYKLTSSEQEVIVVDNVDQTQSNKTELPHEIGYQTAETSGASPIEVEFYRLTDIPETVTFTYNYNYAGEIKKTESHSAYTLYAYPELSVLPDFIDASKPEGILSSDINGQTIDIECTDHLPFIASTVDDPVWYYFEGAGMRYYNDGNDNFSARTSAQASTLNDIDHDLWCIIGNPFDGFEFYNKSAASDHYLNLYAPWYNSGNKTITLRKQNDGTVTKWDVYDNSSLTGSNETFAVAQHGGSYDIHSTNNFWYYTGSGINTNGAAEETGSFRLTEPTFDISLNYSAADDATFATTCLPFAVENADENAQIYQGLLNEDGTQLTMEAIENVPAGTGVILKGNTPSTTKITLRVIADADELGENALLGTTEEMTDLSNVLVFGRSNDSGKVGFFRAGSNLTSLKANRAYLSGDNISAQSVAMNFEGRHTGINEELIHNNNSESAPIYDLSGRMVTHTVKGGLYIKNGRKFIAR